jgi:hypothetical protein
MCNTWSVYIDETVIVPELEMHETCAVTLKSLVCCGCKLCTAALVVMSNCSYEL